MNIAYTSHLELRIERKGNTKKKFPQKLTTEKKNRFKKSRKWLWTITKDSKYFSNILRTKSKIKKKLIPKLLNFEKKLEKWKILIGFWIKSSTQWTAQTCYNRSWNKDIWYWRWKLDSIVPVEASWMDKTEKARQVRSNVLMSFCRKVKWSKRSPTYAACMKQADRNSRMYGKSSLHFHYNNSAVYTSLLVREFLVDTMP